MINDRFLYTTGLDVMEESILEYDPAILRMLLLDKTSKKNILWATKDNESLGEEYGEYFSFFVKCCFRFFAKKLPLFYREQMLCLSYSGELADDLT